MDETREQRVRRWFYYGMNKEEIISYWEEKLKVAQERIAALEAELKALDAKNKQIPSFMATGSFCKGY